jgi:hypothetical protein
VNVPPAGINARFPETTPLHSADNEGKVTFRTQTILVQVPVIVANKSGEHLRNLTKDDFHIFENGKEQKISNFQEIVTANTKLPLVARKPGEYVNLTLSDNEPRAITVIAIDTVNAPFLDQESGRRALIKYLGSVLDPKPGFGLDGHEQSRSENHLRAYRRSQSTGAGAQESERRTHRDGQVRR